MPKGATVSNLVFWIDSAIKNSGGYLCNVVINCHGNAGCLSVGGLGDSFGIESASLFEKLRSTNGRYRIGRIWFVACSVTDGVDGLGANFCKAIAKAANCKVIAANVSQEVGTFYEIFRPFGCIDDFEGDAFEFEPDGSLYTFKNQIGTAY